MDKSGPWQLGAKSSIDRERTSTPMDPWCALLTKQTNPALLHLTTPTLVLEKVWRQGGFEVKHRVDGHHTGLFGLGQHFVHAGQQG